MVCTLFMVFFLTPAFAENPSITVSTNNTPLDRQALQALSKEAFSRLGIEFKLVSLPSERSLLSADAGEIDGEGLRVAGLSSNYPNLIQIPERYSNISFVAFAKDATIKVNDWEGLKPYRLGHITGWKLFEAKTSGSKSVMKVDTPEQLFKMLETGRIDLALYTEADGVALARKLGYSTIAPIHPSLKDVDMFLYLHKKHKALVDKVATTLQTMKADGTYNRIMTTMGTP